MPVEKVPGGWRWGQHGKTYRQKWRAALQGRAIKASEAKNGKPWTHR